MVSEESLIKEYLPLVKSVLNQVKGSIPSNIDLDDLYSAGVSGLMNACAKCDRTQLDRFPAYAKLRIKGAMIDWRRRTDCIPRRARAKKKELDRAVLQIEARTLKPATEDEIAAEMRITVRDVKAIRTKATAVSFTSLEKHLTAEGAQLHDFLADTNEIDASKQIERDEMIEQLLASIDKLSCMERRIICARYFENKTLEEIGLEFNIKRLRITRIHNNILEQLKKKVAA